MCSVSRRASLGLVGFSLVQALRPQSINRKKPSRIFDIRSLLAGKFQKANFTIHGFCAANEAAYFLASPGPVTRESVIIRTDLDGKSLGSIVPPPAMEVLDFTVDDQGSVYVLAGEGTRSGVLTWVFTYEAGGKLRSMRPTKRFGRRLCVVQGKVVILLPGGRVSGLELHQSDGSVRGPFDLHRAFRYALLSALPDGRVVIVDCIEPGIEVVDPDSMSHGSFPLPALSSPSPIQADPGAPSLGRIAFRSLVTSSEGQIFLLGANFRLTDGAPVFRFDSRGALIECLRFELPAFERYQGPNNTGGHISVNRIGLSRGVFLLAGAHGEVAVYHR